MAIPLIEFRREGMLLILFHQIDVNQSALNRFRHRAPTLRSAQSAVVVEADAVNPGSQSR